MTPTQTDPLCHALRTEALLTILAEYLLASAANPEPQRAACALHLAEVALRSAVHTTRALDVAGVAHD